MAEKALENVLHYKCPEWNESIRSARSEVGFSFDLRGRQLWEWLVSGGHTKVLEVTGREVTKLGVDEFYEYYLCCFYSDYERSGGTVDFEAIKGPPWVTLKCPATEFGEDWQKSIKNAREYFDRKLDQKEGLSRGKTSGEFMSWYIGDIGCDEVAEYAIQQVHRLGTKEENALLLVCCMLPVKVKWLVDKSGTMFKRFPQLMDWEHFALTCPNRIVRRQVRAYPSGIDWSEGVQLPDNFPPLPKKLGIVYRIERDANSRLTLSVAWDPLIVTSTKEVTEAVGYLQKYYKKYYEPHITGRVPGILEKLIQQKRKGGRPQWGVAQDAIALECARLKDKEGLKEPQVAEKFQFPVQEDSYGKLTQSSTARRYIKRGRQLLAMRQKT